MGLKVFSSLLSRRLDPSQRLFPWARANLRSCINKTVRQNIHYLHCKPTCHYNTFLSSASKRTFASARSSPQFTLRPAHISWNLICLMVWNIPVCADHRSNFLLKYVVLIKPQASVMWRESCWRRRGAGCKHWGCYGGGSVCIFYWDERHSNRQCVCLCVFRGRLWMTFLPQRMWEQGGRQSSCLQAVSLQKQTFHQIKESNNNSGKIWASFTFQTLVPPLWMNLYLTLTQHQEAVPTLPVTEYLCKAAAETISLFLASQIHAFTHLAAQQAESSGIMLVAVKLK